MKYRDIDIIKTWTMQSTLNFTRYFFKEMYKRKFVVGTHHLKIADALDRVFRGECTRLIINIAPRYGKTELAVKGFIANGLAINPRAKFIHLSYSDDLARDNSRGVQDIVREDAYQRLFPGTMPTTSNTRKWTTASGGGLYAVSSAGQVTGFGAGLVDEDDEKELEEALKEIDGASVGASDGASRTRLHNDGSGGCEGNGGNGLSCNDGSVESIGNDGYTFGGAIVIDDPIKPDDARSEQVRDKVNNKFESTIRNRVNSRNTPIIIIMQRLDENDLCGYLQKLEPDDWEVLSLPCIYEDESGDEQALWPFKHTLDELHALRDKNAFVFDTQYMQNPKPLEGLMYERGFRTYEKIPIERYERKKNYTDTADEGSDFLCSICYDELPSGMYVTDVLFTQKPMEYTEVATAEMMSRNGTKKANIESNNGGRGFARAVEKQCRCMGNTHTTFHWFHQALNKNVRIFQHSNEVQNLIFMPVGWDRMWPQFYAAVTNYMKTGKNAHDDAPDVLTGMVEYFENKRGAENVFDLVRESDIY